MMKITRLNHKNLSTLVVIVCILSIALPHAYSATSTEVITAKPQITLFKAKPIVTGGGKEEEVTNSFRFSWASKNTDWCQIEEKHEEGLIASKLDPSGSIEHNVGNGVELVYYTLTCFKSWGKDDIVSASKSVKVQAPERLFPKITKFTITPVAGIDDSSGSTSEKAYLVSWSSRNSTYCTVYSERGYSSASVKRKPSGSFKIVTGGKSPGYFNLMCVSPTGFTRTKSLRVGSGSTGATASMADAIAQIARLQEFIAQLQNNN